MGLRAFPFRSTSAKCSPLLKKKQIEAKKNIRQGAIKSVAIPPILLSWKLNSSSSTVQKTPWTSGMLPLLPLHLLKYVCFLFLGWQSKCSMAVSGEPLICAPNFCDSHLSPKPHLKSFVVREQEVAVFPDVLQSLRHCGKTLGLHFLWWLAWSTGAARDGEEGRQREGTSRRARAQPQIKDCW